MINKCCIVVNEYYITSENTKYKYIKKVLSESNVNICNL